MTAARIVLGLILILQGLFLLFALAFNGGVGEPFVNICFFISAVLMIVLGITKFFKTQRSTALWLGLAAIVFYLPMIWQRFNFSFGPDAGNLSFDTWIVGVVLLSSLGKPNHPLERDGSHGGASR